MLKENKR
jgi:hypothetical protein